MRFLLIGAYLLGFRKILILVLILMGIAIAQRQCSNSSREFPVPSERLEMGGAVCRSPKLGTSARFRQHCPTNSAQTSGSIRIER